MEVSEQQLATAVSWATATAVIYPALCGSKQLLRQAPALQGVAGTVIELSSAPHPLFVNCCDRGLWKVAAAVPWPAIAAILLYLPGIIVWAVFALRCKADTFLFLSTVATVSQDTVDAVTTTVNTTLITLTAGGTFIFGLAFVLAIARSVQAAGVLPNAWCPCGEQQSPVPALCRGHESTSRQSCLCMGTALLSMFITMQVCSTVNSMLLAA